MKTYWVEYTYEYPYINGDTGEIEFATDYDSGRFQCRKRDIKKEVTARIKEEWADNALKELDEKKEIVGNSWKVSYD